MNKVPAGIVYNRTQTQETIVKSSKTLGRRRRGRGIWGFTLVELVMVAGIVASVPTAKYAEAKAKANQTVEISNLRQIGQMLVMYQMDNKSYPKAAFYPTDPLNGDDSIRVILAGKGGKAEVKSSGGGVGGIAGRALGAAGGGNDVGSMFVSAALPAPLQEKGLTYVYNDAIAGKRSIANPSATWVLIDMTCVSAEVPPPYRNGYNVLMADGRVITTKKLPPSIQKLRQQVKKP